MDGLLFLNIGLYFFFAFAYAMCTLVSIQMVSGQQHDKTDVVQSFVFSILLWPFAYVGNAFEAFKKEDHMRMVKGITTVLFTAVMFLTFWAFSAAEIPVWGFPI